MRLALLLCTYLMMNTSFSQWQNKRQLVVFGAPQSKLVQQQLAIWNKEAKGMAERELEVVMATNQPSLYQKYKIADKEAFVVVLVGKDGGEKMRATKPVTTAELFGIIDAMPMRQWEMRRNNKPGQ